MNGIPEYGTGRHEDYLTWQDEQRDAAEPVPGQAAEDAFWAWMDAYVDEPHNASYEVPDMQRAYEAGRAAPELAAQLDEATATISDYRDALCAMQAERDRLREAAIVEAKAIERLGIDRARAMTTLRQIISSGDPAEIDDLANAALDFMQAGREQGQEG